MYYVQYIITFYTFMCQFYNLIKHISHNMYGAIITHVVEAVLHKH